MCVHLKEYKVSYFAVPKCAWTSLKTLFFQVENGRPWSSFKVNGRDFWVHNAYPSLQFADAQALTAPGFWKFAILRDPISRLESCYHNRLMRGRGHKQLLANRDELDRRGLKLRPSFAQFVDRYEDYCDMSWDVRGHSRPLSFFLGREPGYFDRLFRLSELGDLIAELGRRIANLPELLHLQTRGKDIEVGRVGRKTKRQIEEIFGEDFQLFGAYF